MRCGVGNPTASLSLSSQPTAMSSFIFAFPFAHSSVAAFRASSSSFSNLTSSSQPIRALTLLSASSCRIATRFSFLRLFLSFALREDGSAHRSLWASSSMMRSDDLFALRLSSFDFSRAAKASVGPAFPEELPSPLSTTGIEGELQCAVEVQSACEHSRSMLKLPSASASQS